jgi:hypothetical protein
VAAKLEDCNTCAAVQVLTLDDKPADTSSETLVKLLEKYPSAPANSFQSARHLQFQLLSITAINNELSKHYRRVRLVDLTAPDFNTCSTSLATMRVAQYCYRR